MIQLNPGQYKAVHCKDPKILCLAGAGTGKTFALLHRINRLIDEGSSPDSILVLTFTNAAAKNMRDRFEGSKIPTFQTFHAFCYSLLAANHTLRKKLGYTELPKILSDAEYKLVINRAKLDSGVKLTTKQLSGQNLLSEKDKFAHQLFIKFLRRRMMKENLITFDTLCYDVCNLFVQDDPVIADYKRQYRYVMCDEFQDTDKRQWDFIQSFKDSELFVVGDALQNLYTFRGSDSSIIKGLSTDPAWTTIKLTENYRSTQQICDFANNMSHYADDNYRIEITSPREGPAVITGDSADVDMYISQYLTTKQLTAVLARTNKEVSNIRSKYSQYFENYEKYLRLCYAVDVYKSCENPEFAVTFLANFLPANEYTEFLRQYSACPTMTMSQFLALFTNPNIEKFSQEIINMQIALDGVSSYPMELMVLSEFYGLNYDDMFDVNIDINTADDVMHALSTLALKYKDSTDLLYVGTIHSSKGLEYDNVILYNVDSPSFLLNSEDNLNLYYVGITRAKNNLCVLRG